MLLNTIFIVFLPLKCYLKLLRMDVCSVLELILRMGGMCLTVALSLSVCLMSLSSLLLAEVRFFEQNILLNERRSSILDSPKIFGVIRVLRLLRALRPLRVINRAPGVKLVVMTLISSLKPIGNIVLICCTFFIIFGILGVQLFKVFNLIFV